MRMAELPRFCNYTHLSAIITGMNQVDIASDLLINLQELNEDEFYHIEELLGEVYGEEI